MFQGKDLGQRDVHGESYNRYSKRICDQIGQQRDVWGSRRAKPVTNKTTSVYLCHIRVENTSLNQKTLKQIECAAYPVGMFPTTWTLYSFDNDKP